MNVSTVIKHSLLLATASAAMAACSTAPQAGLIPASQTSATTLIPQNHDAKQAIQRLGVPTCPPFAYHGAASVWDANLAEWITYYGWFARVGGILVPCPNAVAIAGRNNIYAWFDPVAYASWWFVQSQARRAHGPSKKEQFVAVPASSQNAVDIVKSTAKKSSVVDTISTAPYTPTSVAVSRDGHLYAAVVPPSGSQSSGIIVYPQGSTTPSETLSDPNLGQSPAQIALDRRDDLFIAYTITSGSSVSARIDEFPYGSTKATPFATIAGATAASLATTRRDDVLISTMRGSSGEVDILDIKGRMAGKIATTANPGFISLNAKNDALTVVDPIDNLVSTYAYPSGQLQIQSSVGAPSQTWVPGGMLQP